MTAMVKAHGVGPPLEVLKPTAKLRVAQAPRRVPVVFTGHLTFYWLTSGAMAWAQDVQDQIIVPEIPATVHAGLDPAVLIIGLGALATLPLTRQLLPTTCRSTTAAGARDMLRDIPGALLIDIRSKGQAQGQGSPDIGPGRSPIRLPYQEDVPPLSASSGRLRSVKRDSRASAQQPKQAWRRLGPGASPTSGEGRTGKVLRSSGRPAGENVKPRQASPLKQPPSQKPGRFFVEKLKSEVKVPKGCPVLLLDGDGSLSKAKGPEVARALGDAVQVYVVQGGFAGPRGWTESGLPVRSTPGPIPFPNLSLGGVRLPLATLPDDGYSLAPLGALLALAAAAYALRGPILGGALQLAGVLGLVQIFLTLASERQRRDAQEEVRCCLETCDRERRTFL
ncbi:POB32 [Auxenochlorella protothecoides x Auxenochlorella symbiontica]